MISMRTLALEAGVSHTLVNYHFGSREGLISAALALRIAPHQVVAHATAPDGSVDLGRLFHELVAVWEDPRTASALHALAARVLGQGPDAPTAQAYLQGAVFDPLVAALGQARARRVAVVVVGTIVNRYVIALPSMARMSRAEVVAQMVAMSR